MREVKFRAWDKEHKAMYDCNSLCRLHFNDGLPYCFYTWEDGMLIKDWELMQYTGLKDKNSVEIYEGDILTLTMIKTGHKCLTTSVRWSETGLNFNVWPPHDDKHWEVIGNIYENKELLDASKG